MSPKSKTDIPNRLTAYSVTLLKMRRSAGWSDLRLETTEWECADGKKRYLSMDMLKGYLANDHRPADDPPNKYTPFERIMLGSEQWDDEEDKE